MSFENEIKDYLDREVETFRKYDIKAISEAMDVIYDAYKREATIYTMGNGGSAATASHMACDFNKGVSMELNKKFHIVSLSERRRLRRDLQAAAHRQS
jgi:D-sedoheptulose 7-phosphate isomerase